MRELLAQNLRDLQALCADAGVPKFRAKQIMDYLYKRYVFNFDEMTQLPANFRAWLKENCTISMPEIKAKQEAPDGRTIKLLLEFKDGQQVETVLMKQSYGHSVCVSTQVGCAMGCIFCASTTEGLLRNLKAYEIISQVLSLASIVKERIHSVVFMGAGEPLQNYVESIAALRFLHEDESFGIGYRRITVSTCGIIENIELLRQEGLPITLALSLHAPNQALRQRIMPIGGTYELSEVLKAVQSYYDTTERRITFEYILIKEVNGTKAHAHELGQLLSKFTKSNVNLIPVNGNEHIQLFKPSSQEIEDFKNIVASYGLSVTVRKEMGDAIQAACGQLKISQQREV